jgi:hypothetical protein
MLFFDTQSRSTRFSPAGVARLVQYWGRKSVQAGISARLNFFILLGV